tara:strand:- start:4113 stop:4439 length:327 start_codon:yes stop_codon:yes gene_type:complete
MKKMYKVNGRAIGNGRGFSIAGSRYPSNFLELSDSLVREKLGIEEYTPPPSLGRALRHMEKVPDWDMASEKQLVLRLCPDATPYAQAEIEAAVSAKELASLLLKHQSL